MTELEKKRLTRRTFVAASAAVPVAGSVAGNVAAQDSGLFMPATPVPMGEPLPPEMAEYAGDWPSTHGNLAGTRAAASSTIDASNVDTLGPAWRLPLTGKSGYGAITSSTIVQGDTVYVHDMQSNFIAVDRATGEVKWTAAFNVGTHGPNGLAVGYGLVIGALGNTGEVAAVDAATGDLVWRVQLTNHPGESITIAPTIYDSTVYVSTVPGNAGTPSGWYTGGTKGILYALDASSGGTMWQWDTTTDNLWGDARRNSGGGLWYPVSIDDAGNLYFGVGNPGPFPGTPGNPNSESRPGANLYTNCMIAFDPVAGEVRWYVQPKTRDVLDLDYQNTPVLATVEINGVSRDVVIGSGKNGYIVCVDRETGNLYWKTIVGKQQNADLEQLPEEGYIEVYPGFNGAVQAPIAYKDGKIFVPVNNWPTWYNATGLDFTRIDESKSSGEFLCIDATTGEVVWHHVTPALPLGSAAVANDVVLSAGTDGIVRAYAAEDGTELWNLQVNAGVNAPVTIAGDMVFVGAGGPFMTKPGQFPDGEIPEPVSELWAFKLGVGGGTVPDEGAAATPVASDTTEEAAQAESVIPQADASGTLALTVEAFDIGFRQRHLTIPADTDVVVTFRNTGAIPHDWAVGGTDVLSSLLDGGVEESLTVNLPAGEYMYYCTVPGHKEAGMAGTLLVQ